MKIKFKTFNEIIYKNMFILSLYSTMVYQEEVDKKKLINKQKYKGMMEQRVCNQRCETRNRNKPLIGFTVSFLFLKTVKNKNEVKKKNRRIPYLLRCFFLARFYLFGLYLVIVLFHLVCTFFQMLQFSCHFRLNIFEFYFLFTISYKL